MSDSCQETAGFLFKHPCPHPVYESCGGCGKGVCDRHVKVFGQDERLCVTCARKQVRPCRAPGAAAGDEPRARQRQRDHGDDPYFYSSFYYPHYGYYGHGHWGSSHYAGHDAADFTEADGQSFQVEADEGFDQDMGAS